MFEIKYIIQSYNVYKEIDKYICIQRLMILVA